MTNKKCVPQLVSVIALSLVLITHAGHAQQLIKRPITALLKPAVPAKRSSAITPFQSPAQRLLSPGFIRDYLPSDKDAVSHIALQHMTRLSLETEEHLATPEQQAAAFAYNIFPELNASDVHSKVYCYNDNQPVGFINYRSLIPAVITIHHLAVKREYHRRGAGRELLSHALADPSLRLAQWAELVTLRNLSPNDPLVLFYRSCGFSQINDRPCSKLLQLWQKKLRD